MKIVDETITLDEINQMAGNMFGNMVKGVVDVERGLLALDGELHSDLEALLLESGSKQKYLWGINLYPELSKDDFVEFDSLINIKPSQGNRTRGIEDKNIQKQILNIVAIKLKK